MISRISIFLGLLVCQITSAQVALDRQVVGSLGNVEQVGEIHLSFTAGEAVVTTIESNDITLTQGFHQPNPNDTIIFELVTAHATCPNSVDGGAWFTFLEGCGTAYEITWSTGFVGDSLGFAAPGTYEVTISTDRCSVTTSFEIFSSAENGCDLKFYNAYSPNGDGMNDIWEIENIEDERFRQNQVEIFNRWGQMVWSGENYDNRDTAWKGKHENGTTLSTGTYFYVAEVAGVKYKGYIELTR